MNPQSWLDDFVRRHQPSLACLRAYVEDAVAEVADIERGICPEPARLPGEVVGMNVRNRVGIRAIESVDFAAGTLALKQVRNRGIRLLERGSGLEIPLRKVKAIPTVEVWSGSVLPQRPVQELLFDAPLRVDGLPLGLCPVLVWSVGPGDALGEFTALVVDGLDELDVATAFAVTNIDGAWGSAGSVGQPSSAAPPVGDDFEDTVRKVPPAAAEETGDTSSGA